MFSATPWSAKLYEKDKSLDKIDLTILGLSFDPRLAYHVKKHGVDYEIDTEDWKKIMGWYDIPHDHRTITDNLNFKNLDFIRTRTKTQRLSRKKLFSLTHRQLK